MFIPGINGSVIPSVSSGSKLKGAYKNSKNLKKRKMPNGGNTGLGMALEAATYVPGPVGMYASGASALANLYQGDYVGAGLDALNMATFGTAKGLMGVSRAANAIRPYSNLAVNAAQASRTVNRVAKKVAPVTRVAGTVNQFTSSPYNATMRVPQRDNAQVQFRPNPNMRRMPNGGIKSSIENISPQGDVQYNVSKNLKNFKAGLQGSVNAPSMYGGSVTPTLSYSKNKFSSYVSPNSLGASVEGDKAYLNYNQTKEGQTMYRDASAGYNTDKVNLNAGVNFRNNSLESGQISGSYNFNPNLAITGNYGVSQGESGLDKNYFAGLRFNKTFKKGGEVEDDDDKEMVDGVASILRGVKDKKNRLQLANKLAKQFNREKVEYNLANFLNKSKVKK
jgi:hypothetical protein